MPKFTHKDLEVNLGLLIPKCNCYTLWQRWLTGDRAVFGHDFFVLCIFVFVFEP